MFCRLDYGVLFSVETPAELMTLTGRNPQLFPQTARIEAVGDAGRGTVISRGKNVFVLDENCSHLPAETGRTAGYEMGYFHEIFIPAGTGHAATPVVNSSKNTPSALEGQAYWR
jgi:hypothetical protein